LIYANAVLAVALAVGGFGLSTQAADAEPLKLKYPSHTPKGTPEDLPKGANVEAISDKPPKPLEVPKGL